MLMNMNDIFDRITEATMALSPIQRSSLFWAETYDIMRTQGTSKEKARRIVQQRYDSEGLKYETALIAKHWG